ncbi:MULTISPECIES: hypothetical protein [Ralstonia solanacearum species complex]|uniref:hypothetical protein n=1 Tax=Ralstonia solanacearum species complex TaxID=3116862 RepID=UPI0009462087|nr:hypothetical protein [Ralstonia solanacearum]
MTSNGNVGARGFSKKKVILLGVLMLPVFYVASCEYISKTGRGAFEAVNIGDTRTSVIQNFGQPSHVEHPGLLYDAYAASPCKAPCAERLWFENRLSIGIEAWSVELDNGGRVVHKAYWMSP